MARKKRVIVMSEHVIWLVKYLNNDFRADDDHLYGSCLRAS